MIEGEERPLSKEGGRGGVEQGRSHARRHLGTQDGETKATGLTGEKQRLEELTTSGQRGPQQGAE
eukprot:4937596-Pyramimonas_sp.AAC.1